MGTFANVMAGRHSIKALIKCIALKDAELHFAVAHNVRIRGDPLLVAFDQIVDHMFAVFIDQIDNTRTKGASLLPNSRIIFW